VGRNAASRQLGRVGMKVTLRQHCGSVRGKSRYSTRARSYCVGCKDRAGLSPQLTIGFPPHRTLTRAVSAPVPSQLFPASVMPGATVTVPPPPTHRVADTVPPAPPSYGLQRADACRRLCANLRDQPPGRVRRLRADNRSSAGAEQPKQGANSAAMRASIVAAGCPAADFQPSRGPAERLLSCKMRV
jgi:hypothetical protein